MKKAFISNYIEIKRLYERRGKSAGPIITSIYMRHKRIYDKYFI